MKLPVNRASPSPPHWPAHAMLMQISGDPARGLWEGCQALENKHAKNVISFLASWGKRADRGKLGRERTYSVGRERETVNVHSSETEEPEEFS